MSYYEIMISPEQREILITALASLQSNPLGADAETREEIDTLHNLFFDLPHVDHPDNVYVDPVTKKRKHVLHGFCL